MKTENNSKKKRNDIKILLYILLGFVFVAWLCSPPGNKFLQICFWGNNTKFFIQKALGNDAAKDYIFHRNNAVYLAKMYPQSGSRAIVEMNKAIATLPSCAPDSELMTLYKERAKIKMFFGDYKGALSDFINSKSIDFNDNLRVALLFKEIGNYREAARYCNNIINTNNTAYSGYACLADIYSTLGRYDIAIKIWDLAIDRKPNNPRAYVDRAKAKKAIGDIAGYDADINIAKTYSPVINLDASIIEDTLRPKILTLTIR